VLLSYKKQKIENFFPFSFFGGFFPYSKEMGMEHEKKK